MAERAKELAGGRPSLLQDVMRGRRTEVQYLNGYSAKQGRQVGLPTPFNDKVVELISRVSWARSSPTPGTSSRSWRCCKGRRRRGKPRGLRQRDLHPCGNALRAGPVRQAGSRACKRLNE